ncbi:MAG: beta-lactamase family protein [Psychrosphaera sp.]|nr:beta-lactamase family protein [Psychrosphaera sp.]
MKQPKFSIKKTAMMLVTLSVMAGLTGCGSSSNTADSSNNSGNNSGNNSVPANNTAPATGQAGDGRLTEIVEYIRRENGLPALSAVMVHDGQIIEMSASGLRSIDSSVPVTTDDKWHVGSLTKSMTSTLAALLVKQGTLQWNTTIVEVFPELQGVMRAEYESVRLDELLSHTSGLTANIHNAYDYYNRTDDITTQRQQMIEEALVRAPAGNKGQFNYSNLGYMIAGAMMERLTGNSWETLLSNNVFSPLLMTNSGFGAPDTQEDLTQPVGHKMIGNSWQPIRSGPADNPPLLGPAGTVHVTLEDMGNYLGAHLAGARGLDVDGLLSAAEFEKLHTPLAIGDYALGWGVINNSLQHSGSNTMWLATMLIYPEKNLALFVATNAADLNNQNSVAFKATNALIGQLSARATNAFGQ